jgi:hypothetical protein
MATLLTSTNTTTCLSGQYTFFVLADLTDVTRPVTLTAFRIEVNTSNTDSHIADPINTEVALEVCLWLYPVIPDPSIVTTTMPTFRFPNMSIPNQNSGAATTYSNPNTSVAVTPVAFTPRVDGNFIVASLRPKSIRSGGNIFPTVVTQCVVQGL